MISMLCRLFYVGILAIIFLYFFIKVVILKDKIKNEKIKNICLVSVIGNYTVNKKRVNVALIRTEFIPKMEENGFTEEYRVYFRYKDNDYFIDNRTLYIMFEEQQINSGEFINLEYKEYIALGEVREREFNVV